GLSRGPESTRSAGARASAETRAAARRCGHPRLARAEPLPDGLDAAEICPACHAALGSARRPGATGRRAVLAARLAGTDSRRPPPSGCPLATCVGLSPTA